MEDGAAFIGEDAAADVQTVVEAGEIGEAEGTFEAAHFGIGHGVDDSGEAGHDGGSGAHGAGFFGDVESGIVEPPIADSLGGHGDGEDFGVGGGIFEAFDAIMGAGDDGTAEFDDGSDGDLVGLPCLEGFVVGVGEVVGVVALQFGGMEAREGTFPEVLGVGGIHKKRFFGIGCR